MAVEVEGSGQLEEFLGILRRRAWWIAVPTILVGTLGIAFAVIVPKKYVSISSILVRDIGGLSSDAGEGAVSILEGQTAPHVIRSYERVRTVLATELGWDEYKSLTRNEEREEFEQRILDALRVSLDEMPRNSGQQIVNLSFSHTDPTKAQDFLVRIIDGWKSEVQSRFRDGEVAKLKQLDDIKVELENDRDELTREIARIQRENGIFPGRSDPQDRSRGASRDRSDLLTDLEAEILELELDVADKESDLAELKKRFDAMPTDVPSGELPELALPEDARVVARLRQEIDELYGRIETNGWLPTHTSYLKAMDEIRVREGQIADLTGQGSSPTRTSTELVPNPEKVAAGREIDELDREIVKLKERTAQKRERAQELRVDIIRLTEVHGDLTTKTAQKNEIGETLIEVNRQLEIQKGKVARIESDRGTFFEDRRKATLPTKPTEPSPILLSVLGVLIGLAIGLGLAGLLEFSKTTFRSARDLSRVMVLPVLGTVNRIVTRRQRARAFFLRSALGTGMIAYVLVIGYVTWTWATDAESLSPGIKDAIEAIRDPFM